MGGTALWSGTLKFSLILATAGRTDDLARFLRHLEQQTYRNFELIIVDQNPDGVLDPVIREYQGKFPLLHLRSERGLSRARNVGLQHFSGDIVAFPDDDCWYAKNTLGRIARLFSERPAWDGITGRCVDEGRPTDYLFFSRRNGGVDKRNVFGCSTSVSIFLRARVVQAVGRFDETLGSGSDQGKHAAEESDYLLRALDLRFNVYYWSDLCIFHPYPPPIYDRDSIKREYRRSMGFGYVLKKHQYPLSSVCYRFLRPLGAALISLLTLKFSKSMFHLAALKGRILGWRG